MLNQVNDIDLISVCNLILGGFLQGDLDYSCKLANLNKLERFRNLSMFIPVIQMENNMFFPKNHDMNKLVMRKPVSTNYLRLKVHKFTVRVILNMTQSKKESITMLVESGNSFIDYQD